MPNNAPENLWDFLHLLGKESGRSSLLVGGLALVEYGVPRPTYDIDIAVSEKDQARFEQLLPNLSYRKIAETCCAARFRHSKVMPDLDLFVLPEDRFSELRKNAVAGKCGTGVVGKEDWVVLARRMRPDRGEQIAADEKRMKQGGSDEANVRSYFLQLAQLMEATFDPISYVIYRQEECPLPVTL